ncbi:MAG: hypothetical protein KGS61_00565 [Verrucomicrobia bacterium]|nr:hypothetical protein [Verrucomicrobiota bacterium]
MPSPPWLLSLLLVICFTLALRLQSWYAAWPGNTAASADLLTVALGDSRQLFANYFFAEADAYFHSGYYPSIFDQPQSPGRPHVAETTDGESTADEEREADFLGKPRDWIERFGRNFFPTAHTHLKPADTGEILPWLELSADLDPHRVETYTVAAYWLRTRLGRVNEAEQFLRQGLRANPDSCEILFELGRVYAENRHDPDHARNLWELALRRWDAQSAEGRKPDRIVFGAIVSHLADLEAHTGRYAQAIQCLERLKTVSPAPAAIQKQIDDLKQRLAAGVH